MKRRIFLPHEIILFLTKLVRGAISRGKFSMPILLLACFFVFGAAARAAELPKITAGNTSSAFSNWKSSFTWKHTIAGNDPVLLVSLHGDGNYLNANSVTYNGQAMTLAAKKVYNQSYNNIAVYIYYLANPPQGEHNITVNIGWTLPFAASAITFNNCDTSNPINTVGSFLAGSPITSHAVSTSLSNAMLVDAATYNLPERFTLTPGQSQTSYFIQPQNSQWNGQTNTLYAGESYKLAEQMGTSTMSWITNGGGRTSVQAIVALNPKYQVVAKEPVIIVPGIMGSYLYSSIDPGVEVWPAVAKTVIDPWDLHLNQLIMDSEGKPSANSMIVSPQDIVRSVLDKDFFTGLIDELKQNGYEENKNLFVFPYDWRLDLNWSANGIPYSGFDSLKDKIEKVKLQTGAQKVNIIAHSMGGLVAKNYIKHYGAGSVNKFIDIGTPHLGAPEALKILMYGDDLDFNYLGLGLNSERIKSISQNFPSVYQLLPSRNYFTDNDQNYSYYLYDMYDLDNNDITGRLNYEQSINFMENTGRNNYLLGFNDALHNDLDDYSPKIDGIKTYNIMGCGQPTIGQIFVLNKEKSGKYEYGLKYISGDGTVPLRSAEVLQADDSYYIRGAEHSVLPGADGIKQIAAAILKDTIDSFSLQNYPDISHNNAGCALAGTQISFHSPIDLNVYDENNNHVGPNANGDIELGIAGAQYDDLDGNKFVFLPIGHNYRVIGQATASGTFNARVQTVENGQYTQTAYYNEMPLDSASTIVQMQINSGQSAGAISIDKNGDQIFETLVEPSAVLNQEEAADLIKPETQIDINGTVGNGGYYISTTTVVLTAADNQGGSGILKTEYSLDNGLTWLNYDNPIIFNNSGEYSISYKATDRAGNIEETKEQKIKLDLINPETKINVSGSLGENDFYTSAATVTLTAADFGGSGLLKIEYSLDNGLNWLIYDDLIIIDNDGEHSILFKSTDLAGNIEENKEQKIKIDKTAPAVNILLPLEKQEFMRDEFFTPEYEINDNYSGAASSSIALLLDGQPISQAQQDLFYYSLGEHVLKITVSDLAGNQAQASVNFIVKANLDSTIVDINRSYSLGWIKNKMIKNWLAEELNEIKKYEEKFGERQKKLEQRREKAMSQCLKKKNQAWCDKKLGKYYNKAIYKLNQTHGKIIAKRFQEILKKIDDYYYKKQWLNKSAYDIIKADINYLINNL